MDNQETIYQDEFYVVQHIILRGIPVILILQSSLKQRVNQSFGSEIQGTGPGWFAEVRDYH